MAKVIFCVPPVKSDKGFAQATQNRQYQWFKDPTYIFPVIPALFVTMVVTEPGNEILWIDCVANEIADVDFGRLIVKMQPDFVVMEANTMLYDQYCGYIAGIKNNLPNIKVILAGEHVSSVDNATSPADHVVKGGKWYKEAFKIVTGKDWGDRPLPHVNRHISRWWLYAYKNGNFKYQPATYTMAAQDCWYRPSKPCTFCTWVKYHPENVIRPVDDFIAEIEGLVNTGFKEFFDDSGTFPVGKWLNEFCEKMNVVYDTPGGARRLSDLIAWGCNMRFSALKPEEFKMMADAGCRFILWGYESANDETLSRLSKGYKIERVEKDLKAAADAGIWNHLTVMMGYPWETLDQERYTYKTVKRLLLKDYASSMQATIFMPYPGTESFRELKEEGLILTEDWAKWDMTNEIVKLKYPFDDALKLQRDYYRISYHPKFIWNKLKRIRNMDDFRFYFRLAKKVVDRFGNVHERAVG